MPDLTQEGYDRLVACKEAARAYLACCATEDEVARAERLLCQEVCACAEDARERLHRNDRPLAPEDGDSLHLPPSDGGAVYCP